MWRSSEKVELCLVLRRASELVGKDQAFLTKLGMARRETGAHKNWAELVQQLLMKKIRVHVLTAVFTQQAILVSQSENGQKCLIRAPKIKRIHYHGSRKTCSPVVVEVY